MKVSKAQLKEIIQEELENMLEYDRIQHGNPANTYQQRKQGPSWGYGKGEIHFQNAMAYFTEMTRRIAKKAARSKLMTGARGSRQIRPEWQIMMQGLSLIAKTIGTTDPLPIFISDFKNAMKQYAKMDVDQRSQLEVENEKEASAQVYALISFMVERDLHEAGWYEKRILDHMLDANADIQDPANWKPTGKFRTEL